MYGTIKRKTKDPTRGSHTVNTADSLPSGVFEERRTDSSSRKNHALPDNGPAPRGGTGLRGTHDGLSLSGTASAETRPKGSYTGKSAAITPNERDSA